MAKASLKLPDGTQVTVEGTPEEVKHLLEVYDGEGQRTKSLTAPRRSPRKSKPPGATATPSKEKQEGQPDLAGIITLVRDCDEAEAIETQILDRTSQVNRTLLPLYIVHEHLGNAFALTSGDIKKITTDLGIPISQPHASRTLSGTASKYVIGDKVKVRGLAVHYKLSRRGVKYMKGVVEGTPGD